MKQIRIMELRGTYKGGGGPDKTILLSAAKHQKSRFFILVTYLRSPSDSEFNIGNIAESLHIRDYVEVYDRRMLDLKCLFELNRLVRKHDIEIIHVHDQKTTLLGVLLKALNPRVRIMNTAHGWIIKTQIDTLKLKIHYQLLKLYPHHIAVSNATKKIMINSGIRESTIKVLYNSIDTDFWKREDAGEKIHDEFSIRPECKVIGTVGRLSAEKDLITFFNMAENILKTFPDALFFVVGDGIKKNVNELRAYVASIGIEKSVIFTGHRTDLKKFYMIFDVFVTTSLTEGLPNTVLESMAMEVPVVATAVGGIPELITHNETGILCDIQDCGGIAEAVLSIFDSPEKKTRIVKNARKAILDTFSFDSRLKAIELVYEEIYTG